MFIRSHAVEDSFESIGRHMNDLMEQMARRCYYRFSKSVAWEPAVNIQEDDENIYLCVELAGMSRDAIVLEAEENKIRIRGQRAVPQPPGREVTGCILHMEINSGAFQRTIELPERANLDSIEAKLDSGFLWITIAKRES